MFIREWVFGEVKQIRKPLTTRAPNPNPKPLGIMDPTEPTETLAAPQTKTKTPAAITITENVSVTYSIQMKECTVSIEKLFATKSALTVVTSSNLSYNMRTRPPKAETSHRTSNQPLAVVDYSKFMSENDDDTSPPHKAPTVDLK